MLADTTFLIDIMKGDSLVLKKAKELEEAGIAIHVGAPTIFELYVGVALSKKSGEEKSKINETISALPQFPLEYNSAVAGGEIYREKSKAGSVIDPEDAMLAGISRVKGEPLLTRNVKHFSGIRGVKVETY